MIVTCNKEIGKWTVRVNGCFVADFWRERDALRLSLNLIKANREMGE